MSTLSQDTHLDQPVARNADAYVRIFEEHLTTDTGKSLVSRYELTHDAQSIYIELKKQAKSSTAAQLSGDTLLKYITSASYPQNWRGTSDAFVLHWKEQVAQYEKLELENVPPNKSSVCFKIRLVMLLI